MAENKKSFLLYCDQIHLFEELADDEAGRLIKHIFRYVNDQDPECPDRITKIGFEPIKHQLKRDLIKYEEKKIQWSEAGKASAEARRLERERRSTDSTNVNGRSNRSTDSTVTVTDNVNVTDKGNTIEQRKLKFASTLEPFKEKYGRELLNSFYKYWTQPNKSGTKFKQELEKTWELSYRLETWASRDKQFSQKENGHEPEHNKTLSLSGIKL